MDTCGTHLLDSQHPQYEAQRDHDPHHRHHLTSYYAHWFIPPGLPRIWRTWYGTPHVDTGGCVRASSYLQRFLSADMLLVRKGLVWLSLATIAYVPPVVSDANFMYPSL
jgi:hypothetical protein